MTVACVVSAIDAVWELHFMSIPSTTASSPALLDVVQVAELCGCSTRTVYRLADRGRMPKPVKLGALSRWLRREIDEWVEAGCPPCLNEKGGGR
jgi:excisionase family DNA binding protein